MEQFEAMVNASIDAHGFRISPRLQFNDRLSRFIEQYMLQQGKAIHRDEAEVYAAILLLRYSMEEKREPRTRSQHQLQTFLSETESDLGVSSGLPVSTHTMKLRSSSGRV